jgi:hypothetical protein
MTLKTAAFLALVGMFLLTVLLLAGFIRDVSSAVDGLIPAVRVVSSLIYLLAGAGVTMFFFVFHKGQ